MTSSGVIWLADDDGFAYTLSLDDNKLTLRSEEADIIKRISAVETCAFAVGGDQNVHLYVNSRDVPIRVQVTTYENQRWNPIHSWSEKSVGFTSSLNVSVLTAAGAMVTIKQTSSRATSIFMLPRKTSNRRYRL